MLYYGCLSCGKTCGRDNVSDLPIGDEICSHEWELCRREMNVSSVDRKSITGQAIVNGLLVTEFRESRFSDGALCHEAGTLVCEQPTQKEKDAYGECDEFGGILSDTVTRLGVLFWDKGVFNSRDSLNCGSMK